MTLLYTKVPCSRCPREVETQITVEEAVQQAKAEKARVPTLQVFFRGEELVLHENLCPSCEETVARSIQVCAKELEHKSPQGEDGLPRKRKAKAVTRQAE